MNNDKPQTVNPKKLYVYRLYDPETNLFVSSGSNNITGRNRRSFWSHKSGATLTKKFLKKDLRDRVKIIRYELTEGVYVT